MKALSPVDQASRRYEEWLGKQLFTIESDLGHKYEKMRCDATGFVFLRGTFYRWVKLWENKRRDLRDRGVLIGGAPEIFCVGDLHIENFGTWRDREGRLIWGVNDVDEAYPMRYLNDLVRLTASAFLAMENRSVPWKIPQEQVCEAVLDGYAEALETEGKPFILDRGIPWLWRIATHPSRTPERFWAELESNLKPEKHNLPERLQKEALKALGDLAPEGAKGSPLFRRRAGVGSLGRPRFVQFFGDSRGRVVREAKAITPSACVFGGMGKPVKNPYRKALQSAARVADPIFGIREGWVVRRLAFDSDKVSLEALASIRDAKGLFQVMGAETANIHLGDAEAADVKRHLHAQNQKRPDWLLLAGQEMVQATKRDFDDFLNGTLGKTDDP